MDGPYVHPYNRTLGGLDEYKIPLSRKAWRSVSAALIFAMCTFGTYSSTAVAADVEVTLAGDQEVPPVKSGGSGSGSITVGADKSVSGSVVNHP
jgi:hypothetical protein